MAFKPPVCTVQGGNISIELIRNRKEIIECLENSPTKLELSRAPYSIGHNKLIMWDQYSAQFAHLRDLNARPPLSVCYLLLALENHLYQRGTKPT